MKLLYSNESFISLDFISSPIPIVAIIGLLEQIDKAGQIFNPFQLLGFFIRVSESIFEIDFELMKLSRVPSTISNSKVFISKAVFNQ